MKRNALIGRKIEIGLINKYYQSTKSEMIAVYGRRRVGKTFLVKETLGSFFDFDFIGMHKTAAKIQRREFQKKLNSLTGREDKDPSDWFEAFDNLKKYLML